MLRIGKMGNATGNYILIFSAPRLSVTYIFTSSRHHTSAQQHTKEAMDLQRHELGCSYWTFFVCVLGKVLYFSFLLVRYEHTTSSFSQKSLQLTNQKLND